jgi:glucose dehydrogenase
MFCALIQRLSSPSRLAIIVPTSSGSPIRPSAVYPASMASNSSFRPPPRSVRIAPGAPVAFSGTPAPLTPVSPAREQREWSSYGNDQAGTRFAALDQITRDNVSKLPVAWTYHTGDVALSSTGNEAEDPQTPLQIPQRNSLSSSLKDFEQRAGGQ